MCTDKKNKQLIDLSVFANSILPFPALAQVVHKNSCGTEVGRILTASTCFSLSYYSSAQVCFFVQLIILQGLTGGDSQYRYDFILTDCAAGGECYTLYLEVAANGICGAGENGLINAPNPNKYYSISLADVAVFDRDVYNLLWDLKVMLGVIQVPYVIMCSSFLLELANFSYSFCPVFTLACL